jgi:hypothetical protein
MVVVQDDDSITEVQEHRKEAEAQGGSVSRGQATLGAASARLPGAPTHSLASNAGIVYCLLFIYY